METSGIRYVKQAAIQGEDFTMFMVSFAARHRYPKNIEELIGSTIYIHIPNAVHLFSVEI